MEIIIAGLSIIIISYIAICEIENERYNTDLLFLLGSVNLILSLSLLVKTI